MLYHATLHLTITISIALAAISVAPTYSMRRAIKNVVPKAASSSRLFSSSRTNSPYPYSYKISGSGVKRIIDNPEQAGSDHENIMALHELEQKLPEQDDSQESVIAWTIYYRNKQGLNLDLDALEKGRRE